MEISPGFGNGSGNEVFRDSKPGAVSYESFAIVSTYFGTEVVDRLPKRFKLRWGEDAFAKVEYGVAFHSLQGVQHAQVAESLLKLWRS